MKFTEIIKRNQNRILAMLFAVLMCTIISAFFDYYFDLNDDVLMKDILAGIFTGTPNGRNIQMLFPISWFISLFYHIPGNISWYGLFLCGCQFFSIYLVTVRLLSFLQKVWMKMMVVLVEGALIITLFLYEMVFVQYTVTSTMLAAAAAFLFYTSKCDVKPGKFIKNNVISIILVILAFQIRSEMLLLVFPMICVIGLCKWASEKPFFTKENAIKYFSVFGAILLGMLVSEGIHMAAYSSTPWQQFNSFFDSRTEVYDFYVVPPYEENKEFYDSIGLTESEQVLLHNYNFGLDERIDDQLLAKISEYAATKKAESSTFKEALKQAIKDYRYIIFSETDNPYNTLVIILYFIVLLTALLNKQFHILWELPVMGFVRSSLWVFILFIRRYPPRITHSLYLMEIVILLALFLMECRSFNKKNGILRVLFTVFLSTFSALCISNSVRNVYTEYTRREGINQDLLALQAYTREKSDNFYFLDVYSTVSYSEKMFVDVNNSYSNYDIMGGWACKSPLMRDKYEKYGIQSMEEALLDNDNVYFVVQSPEPRIPVSHDWLPAYYLEQNKEIELVKIDSINTAEGEAFTVYKLQLVNN